MTELILEGKYIAGKRQGPVRVALPFQTIENWLACCFSSWV